MAEPNIWKSKVLLGAAALVFACFLLLPWARVLSEEIPSQGKEGKSGSTIGSSEDYSKEITRKGKTVVVSKMLADKIRADNSIVMSAVTVKASVDKRGKGSGYKIVAVDRGSLAQKLGIVKNDIIQEVNGLKLVSSDDLNTAEERFRDSTDFKVKIQRKGRVQTLYYAIR